MSDGCETQARLFRGLGHPAPLQILDIWRLIMSERKGIQVCYRLASPDL